MAEGGEQQEAREPEEGLAMAHVLFLDIVGYSKLSMERQRDALRQLQGIVRGTPEFGRAENQGQLLSLPTGDGMALVFFTPTALSPVRCALEIGRELRGRPELALRMGVHSGPVYPHSDIRVNENVVGGGINVAQRVMDCGDAGHILLSKAVADMLIQLGGWERSLQDLGEIKVKHKQRVHVFNLHTGGAGNEEPPRKYRRPRALRRAALTISVCTLSIVLGLIGFRSWLAPTVPTATPTPAPAQGEKLALTYWLTVRRTHDREPFPSIGEKIFDAGSEFRLNFQTAQAGALYLFSEGKNDDGVTEWNTMFPTRANNNGDAWLQANPDRALSTEEYVFGGRRGTVKVWVIWSRERIGLLDEIVKSSLDAKGVIQEPARLQSFIEQHRTPHPEIIPDKNRFRVTLKGSSDILVDLRELEYQP
jgi:class 3 adenylate cyclase